MHLPSRMPQLSLSWLGLGPRSVSPWLFLLLLISASWLLARILTRIYVFYNNCCRLRCFSQPPRRNWFLGHLGVVSEACLECPGCLETPRRRRRRIWKQARVQDSKRSRETPGPPMAIWPSSPLCWRPSPVTLLFYPRPHPTPVPFTFLAGEGEWRASCVVTHGE